MTVSAQSTQVHGVSSARVPPRDVTGTTAPTFDPPASAAYVWYVLGLLFAVNVFNYTDRIALSVLAPSIKADLQLSDSELGLLIGFAFSIFYAVCGVPVARWSDRGIRRNIVAITLTVWSVMTALSGAAQTYGHLFAARIGVGVGEAGCVPAGQSIISDYVPPQKRAGGFAIHSLGLMAGMMLGMAATGWLDETIGWRMTFVVLGLPGIVLAILVRLTLREPVRGYFDAATDAGPQVSFLQTLAVLFRRRTYALFVVALLLNGFANFGLTQWWPSFYAREFALSRSALGVYLGMSIGVGAAIGLLAGGVLANRLAARSVKLPLIVGAVGILFAIPTALGSLFVPSVTSSILLVGLTAMFWSVHNGPVLALIFSVVPMRMRATAVAVSLFFTSALGLGLGPVAVGFLSDLLQPTYGIASLRYAMLVPIGCLPFIVIALLAASRHLSRDLLVSVVEVREPGKSIPRSLNAESAV